MAVNQPEFTLNWSTAAGVTHPAGYRAGTTACGLRKVRPDLMLLVSDVPAAAAGVFTTNLVRASSVDFSRAIVEQGTAQAIFCKAGNANACTGAQGEQVTRDCATATAATLGFDPGSVLVTATGIIGRQVPFEKIATGLPQAANALGTGHAADLAAAEAIRTTDTFAKHIALTATSPHWEGELRFGGICKGSGMIAPNMATTLCFITTDAGIAPALLQRLFAMAMDRSFNRITVDGDTSTNDTALILANGLGPAVITDKTPASDDFLAALSAIAIRLAQMVAQDGEGATKRVDLTVKGARYEMDAVQIGKTVAESPLVKTAFFGNDPNWGRIVAAAGRAGVPFDPDLLSVAINGIPVFDAGGPVAFDHDALVESMRQPILEVVLDLHAGEFGATIWTCDFSYDYVRINAEYTT